jgi:hypothetical protein
MICVVLGVYPLSLSPPLSLSVSPSSFCLLLVPLVCAGIVSHSRDDSAMLRHTEEQDRLERELAYYKKAAREYKLRLHRATAAGTCSVSVSLSVSLSVFALSSAFSRSTAAAPPPPSPAHSAIPVPSLPHPHNAGPTVADPLRLLKQKYAGLSPSRPPSAGIQRVSPDQPVFGLHGVAIGKRP